MERPLSAATLLNCCRVRLERKGIWPRTLGPVNASAVKPSRHVSQARLVKLSMENLLSMEHLFCDHWKNKQSSRIHEKRLLQRLQAALQLVEQPRGVLVRRGKEPTLAV